MTEDALTLVVVGVVMAALLALLVGPPVWLRVNLFWHDRVLRHTIQERRVTVPMWDPSARGILYRCKTAGCGKVWTR